MPAPGRLPALCELRSPVGLRARPVCVSLCGSSDHCVVGFEDGAVAAWRVRDFPAREDVTPASPSPAELGPAWVVRELSGSDGDGCPVDALALLPPCIAHPSGAVAVAHGGVDADVVGVGGYVPRPARVAVLDLDTGREIRLLTLPMSWPNGGVCPVASLVPAGAEGGVVAVSAARVYRVGEGASGFQGSFACLAAWSGASPVPVAVIPVGPQHTPALGPDPSFESTGGFRTPRARLPSAPILEPFAGLSSSSAPRDDGGEGVVVILRAAHVVLETSTGVLRACPMEWRLAQPAAPLGVALRPTRHVEFASALVGARSTMETLRVEAARAANDTLPDFPEANTSAPAVATWWWGMAAAWDGCEPRAKTWRFGTATVPNDFEEQPAASAALDACARGARRRVANLAPMPNVGRVLALTRDVSALRDVPRLFVTRAGDPREGGVRRGGGGSTSRRWRRRVGRQRVARRRVARRRRGRLLRLLRLRAASSRGRFRAVSDLSGPARRRRGRGRRLFSRARCRRDLVSRRPRAVLPRGVLSRVSARLPRRVPTSRVSALQGRGRVPPRRRRRRRRRRRNLRRRRAAFREISLDIERVAATDADAETNDAAVSSSRPPSSLPAALVGDVSDDFLRPPSSLASDPSASDTPPAALSDDFLRGLAASETEANLDRTSPAAASFVGAARICEDASLVRRDRRTVDADDVNGLLVALTTRGAAVFDAGEEALAALFRDER